MTRRDFPAAHAQKAMKKRLDLGPKAPNCVKLSKHSLAMKEVSIVIPFRNAATTLGRCLGSLLHVDHDHFEVILVDNGSTDASAQIASKFISGDGRRLCTKLVREEMPGASAARNRGVQEAIGSYFAFTDADCIVTRDWLKETLAAFVDNGIGAVAGSIVGFSPRGSVDAFHCLFTLPACSNPRTYNGYHLNSGGFPAANLVVRAEAFKCAGGFDNSNPIYGEDHDLCARIYKAGYAIQWVPSGLVYHIHRSSFGSTCRQAFNSGFGHALLLSTHFERLLLIETGIGTLRSTRFPLRVWLDLGAADKKILGFLLGGLLFWPCAMLIPAYFIYLLFYMADRARKKEVPIRNKDLLVMAAALIAKSAGMTAGRIRGSLRHGVVCI
jgi:GT2 family glycosyltransferase